MRSGDSVIINPPQRHVAISGGVNNPAIYELKDNETLDDLVNIAQQGLTNRQGATKKANQIIEHQAKDFYHKTKQIKNTPTIKILRNQFEKIALAEAKKAKNSIKIGSSSEEVINKLISNLTKKFLHGPTKAIRENEQDVETDLLIKKIYNIKEEKK